MLPRMPPEQETALLIVPLAWQFRIETFMPWPAIMPTGAEPGRVMDPPLTVTL